MKITEAWIRDHVNYGAPNRDQVKLLGLTWPLRSGWMQSVEGNHISDEDAAKFEILHGTKKKDRPEKIAAVEEVKQEDFLTSEFKSIMSEPVKSKFRTTKICDCQFDVPPWEDCIKCPLQHGER